MCTLCAPFAPLCTIALRFFQNMVYRTVYKIQIQAFTPNFRSLAQQTKKLGEMCTLCTPCALLCTAARCKWCSMILSKLCHSPEELTLKIWEKSLHRDWNWGLDTPGYHKPSIVQCSIKSDRKWMLLLNNCYKIVSGHFFAICIFIFHKTKVQTVILRCLTGLNHNWFKSYGLRCSQRPSASSVNFWKIASDKWPFYDHIWPFFGNYMIMFDKTEI